MVERISALHGRANSVGAGVAIAAAQNKNVPAGEGMVALSESAVTLSEIPQIIVHQIAAWHDTLAYVAAQAAQAAGVQAAPPGGRAAIGRHGALLRIAPLQWWLLGGEVPALAPAQGATLDLSHARSQVRISGAQAAPLLNRHIPLDLRPHSFPCGAVASSTLHHVGVTLWHSPHGYELWIPRSFALSIWEMLVETAAQFGAEIA